ncbi:MAG: 4a-hydroxytetrahydrobiopterin dehydratase, partial [Dermatophilaceae bacterium]
MSSTPTPAVLGPDDLAAALDRLPDWRGRLGALHTAYVAPSAVAALALVAAIGKAAESVDHYLDVDWRYDHVFVRSTTHQAGDEVTEQDIRLATRISAIAAAAGAVAEPTLARTVEIGMDSADPDALKSTWQTALGYRLGRSGD